MLTTSHADVLTFPFTRKGSPSLASSFAGSLCALALEAHVSLLWVPCTQRASLLQRTPAQQKYLC